MAAKLPAHVWVKSLDGETAGLLLGWEQRPNAEWWGKVVAVEAGEPVLQMVKASLLRPAGRPTDQR